MFTPRALIVKNLSDDHKAILRWIVGKIRKNQLAEKIFILWHLPGVFDIIDCKDMLGAPNITRSGLSALGSAGLIDIEKYADDVWRFEILQQAYDAVDSNFVMGTPPNDLV